MKKLHVNIVNYEQALGIDAILTKYSKQMQKALIDLGHDCTISDTPVLKTDVNHHINYISYQDCPTVNTTMVTHFTSDMQSMDAKIGKMKQLSKNCTGICFSQGVKDYLIREGVPKNKLEVVLPAHDSLPRRPRLIFLAFKVYPDGRKREQMLVEACKRIKDVKKFIFRIIGPNWKPVLDELYKMGFQVYWQESFNLELYKEALDTSDYILYTGGEDAVAQCLIDAKQAGLRIIAPHQEDIEVDVSFRNQKELNAIFNKLEENKVENWTWENYCKKHISIWEKLLKK